MKKLCFNFFYLVLILILVFLNVNFVYATNNLVNNSDSILSQVQKNYQNIKTIEANFSQDSHSEALGQDEKSSGIFRAFIPNNIKVQYKLPREQVYLVTNEGLTYINYNDKQVVKDSADSVLKSKLPLTFLAGVGDLKKDFDIERISLLQNSYKFDLKPKDDGEIEDISLWIDKKSLLVNKLFVKELGDNTITFELSNIVLNKNVSSKDFKIEIPKGFDFINNNNN